MKLTTKNRKKYRVRNKLKKISSSNRFRVCISRSLNNISAQIIDDVKSITILFLLILFLSTLIFALNFLDDDFSFFLHYIMTSNMNICNRITNNDFH